MTDDDLIDGDPYDPAVAAHNDAEIERQRNAEVQKVTAILQRRQDAYRRVFQGAPMGDDVVIVMVDLTAFCRGEETTFHTDARIHALLTGRNEVYRRIQDHLRLDLDTLLQKYTQPRAVEG